MERNYTPSLTVALYCGWVVNALHRPLYPREYPLRGPRDDLDECRKSRRHLETHLNIVYILCRYSIFGLYAFSDVYKLLSMYIVTPLIAENIFLLPKNMTTREMQYLRLKTEEPILG